MQELTQEEALQVGASRFKIKLHFNIFTCVFSSIGAFLIGGPVGAGMVIGAHIAAQGSGNLYDMSVEHFGNQGIQQ